MGLFGGKSSDSKARIEELKKKIQAEQAALAAPTPPAAPAAPAAPPAPQPTPPTQSYQQPPPMPVHHQEPRKKIQVEELFEEEPEIEPVSGIVLDLGDGMSLNLPIKTKMRLDEFLHVADRVREFQRIQH